MQKILRIFILIYILIYFGACSKPVETVYYEEKDITLFTTKPFKVPYRSREIELEVVKECPGKVICIEKEVKLKIKHDAIFDKIVDSKKSNNETYAKVYANELAEIRKMKNMVSNAKLSMEQVQLRLNTVSELGDVVVTLSPCMSLIKGLSTSLGEMMPSAAASMQDLSTMLGDIVSGSSVTHDGSVGITETSSSDALSILEEAQSVVEGNIRNNMPEPPVTTIDSILAEKESPI